MTMSCSLQEQITFSFEGQSLKGLKNIRPHFKTFQFSYFGDFDIKKR